MHYSSFIIPILATLSVASAAVIPPNTATPPLAGTPNTIQPTTTGAQDTATTLDHCIQLLTAHNNEGKAGVPTVSDEVSAAVTKCGRCLNTADLACGQKGYTKPEMISDTLMQCYVNFWPKSKCA